MNGEIFALYSNRRGRRIDDIQTLNREMMRQGKGMVVFSKKKREMIENRFQSIGAIQDFQMGNKDICFWEFNMANKELTGLLSR